VEEPVFYAVRPERRLERRVGARDDAANHQPRVMTQRAESSASGFKV
jgi:hypothetical protein